MAVIESTRFGTIEIDDELLFSFPRGIPGFEHARRFVIVERDDNVFKWLQAADDPQLAFVIADPHYFEPSYDAAVSNGELKLLKLRFPEDLAAAVIVNVPPSRPQDMTVNLRAPLLFNIRERVGVQVILTSSRYPVDYPAIRDWQRKTAAYVKEKDGGGGEASAGGGGEASAVA